MTTSTAADALPTLRQDVTVIGLVGLAHGASHFSQLLLAPLFPWLKDAFSVSYAELGVLLTVFYVTSCAVQTISGFFVDRLGPRPVLMGGLATLALSTATFAAAPGYAVMLAGAVLLGIGNGVFHPVDYTLLNRKVGKARLGHAYSAHGVTGSLGWALAPAMAVPVAVAHGWRASMWVATALILAVLAVVWLRRGELAIDAPAPAPGTAAGPRATVPAGEGPFDFLRIPAVWMCFAFFLFYAAALSVVQAFAPEAARQLHDVPVHLVAVCLSVYMVCSATGMVFGGFLASEPERCERVVGVGMATAAGLALVMALADVPGWSVPFLFGLMGLVSGSASPSRDMLVKRSTPANASGRVFGVVYSGLDIGQAIAPLFFGPLLDQHQYRAIWIGLAALQLVLVVSAFRVRHVRREVLAPA